MRLFHLELRLITTDMESKESGQKLHGKGGFQGGSKRGSIMELFFELYPVQIYICSTILIWSKQNFKLSLTEQFKRTQTKKRQTKKN